MDIPIGKCWQTTTEGHACRGDGAMRTKGMERLISATMNAGRRRSENGGGASPFPLIHLMFLLFLTLLPLLCPAGAFAWPIPDSGQTKCHNYTAAITCPRPGAAFYSQEGNYIINPISYAKAGTGDLIFPNSSETIPPMLVQSCRLNHKINFAQFGWPR